LFYAFVSLPFKTNWYYYFRNSSIVYSAFGFFLGFHLYAYQFNFFKKIRIWIYGYAFLSFGLRWEYLIDRNAYTFWFALLQKNWKTISVLAFILVNVLYFAAFTSMSVVMILLVILFLRYFVKSYGQFKLFALAAAVCFIGLFIVAAPYLSLYKNSHWLFGDVLHVYAQHPLFNIDHNTSWRLIFWYRMLVESFPQNLIGFGIGTPLLPYTPGVTTSDLPFSDEYISHVIGAHNTFVTIYVRFGILSLLLFAVIYRSVFREFFFYKKYYLTNHNDSFIFLSFIALTTVGLFNLLIETPTLAMLYWVSLGFVAKAINNRQHGNFPVQNL
jgi:hypothetical protein